MRITIVPPQVTNNFTQIPNEILFHAALSDRDKIVWMFLRSVCHGAQPTEYHSLAHVAEKLDMPARNLQRNVKTLIDTGFIRKFGNELHLEVESIEPSIEAQPAPKATKRQELREELVKAWNSKKPENFPAMRGRLPEARLDVLQQHAEMVDCEDLVAYVSRILLACKMNDWYKKVPQTFDNVFGVGKPSLKKLEKTQKMFQEAQGTKAEAAGFDRTNDQSWIEWFASKGHEFSTVERLTMERYTAWEHETENADKEILYVYSDEDGNLVHWTYKEHQAGVSYLPTAN